MSGSVGECESKVRAQLDMAERCRNSAVEALQDAVDASDKAVNATTIAELCSFAAQAKTAAKLAQQGASCARTAWLMAQQEASSCPGSIMAADAVAQAQTAANEAQSAVFNANNAFSVAEGLCNTCKPLLPVPITIHVLDDDSYSGKDNVPGANVTIRNLTHPTCPETVKGGSTDGNGLCTITGAFKESEVLVTVEYQSYSTSQTYNVADSAITKTIIIPDLDV